MPLWNLTLEKVEKLKKQKMEKEDELEDLRATSVQDIWLKDLDAELELALDEFDTLMEQNNKRRKRVGKGQEIVSSKLRVQGVYTAERSAKEYDIKQSAGENPLASTVLSNVPVNDVSVAVDADIAPKVSKSRTKKRKSPAKKTSKKKVKSKKKEKDEERTKRQDRGRSGIAFRKSISHGKNKVYDQYQR